MNNYYYLDVSLEIASNSAYEVTPAFFKKHITDSVKQLFGEVEAAVTVDLLKYNQSHRRAILRVPKSHYVKLRSSLTLAGTYEATSCVYRVNKVSPLLLGLIGDSRQYSH